MHSLVGWPKYPHLQGFIAQTNIKLEGYSILPEALETVILPSSSGALILSIALTENSANSSKKSIPQCAKEISPGRGIVPPPQRATSLVVW